MIIDTRAVDHAIAHSVEPERVQDRTARAIIKAAIARHAEGQHIDALTVCEAAGIQWPEAQACMDIVTTATEAAYYAQRVARYADLDRFAILGQWIQTRAAKTSPDDAPALAGEIGSATDRAMQAGRLMVSGTLSDAGKQWLDRVTAPIEHNIMLDWPVERITSEMGRLDAEIVWLMAQPSLGKTAFVLQWLICLAMQGHLVSFASLESSAQSIASRAISQIAPMNNWAIRQRRASEAQIRQAYQAAAQIPEHIRITDGSMTLDQLYAWGKAEARRGSRIIIVDNTRHIRVPGFATDRINATAEISTRMKQLRDDTGVPVVVLHHTTIDRKTGTETASWSSDIRKDADIIAMLRLDEDCTREPVRHDDPGLYCVRFCVDKNRDGRAGFAIQMRFRKEWQLFERWMDPEMTTEGWQA